ncbi:hypothetical protein K883_01306 [Mycobacterium sp. TKK-01-0059]|nr:hypothetical protein K883_01306 [Mycobacterium sp. TKK-01-0059]
MSRLYWIAIYPPLGGAAAQIGYEFKYVPSSRRPMRGETVGMAICFSDGWEGIAAAQNGHAPASLLYLALRSLQKSAAVPASRM